jgi:hypothetical protein
MSSATAKFPHTREQAELAAHTEENDDCLPHPFPYLSRGRIAQKPDFYVTDRGGQVWIGDAKYKHLAKGQSAALAFALADGDDEGTAAGRLLSPNDVRQLTVYAELDRRRRKGAEPARLLLLYPFGGEGSAASASAVAWNGTPFTLAPVRVSPTGALEDNLPGVSDLYFREARFIGIAAHSPGNGTPAIITLPARCRG